MSDLIDRQAALAWCKKDDWGTPDERWRPESEYGRYIETLPSAQPGWIQCSERLPKPNEYENDVRVYYLVQNEHGDMMVCSWDGCCWMQMYCNTHVKDKVLAWMPLPIPYREGGQEQNHESTI